NRRTPRPQRRRQTWHSLLQRIPAPRTEAADPLRTQRSAATAATDSFAVPERNHRDGPEGVDANLAGPGVINLAVDLIGTFAADVDRGAATAEVAAFFGEVRIRSTAQQI